MKTLVRILPTVAGLAVLSSAPWAVAKNDSWNSGGADNNWSTAANWGGSAVAAGDSLFFGSGARTSPSNDFAAGTLFGNLTFNTGSPAFTLGGNAIVLSAATASSGKQSGGGINNLSGSSTAASQTVGLPLNFAPGNHFLSNATNTGTLNLAGTITRVPGAVLIITNPGPNSITTTGSGLANDNNILGGWAFLGNDYCSVDSSGKIVAGPQGGYTAITDGALATGNANYKYSSDTGAGLTAADGTTLNSLRTEITTANENLLITGTLKLGPNGGIYCNGAANKVLTVTNGTLTANGGGEITLADAPFSANNNNIVVRSVIANDGPNVVGLNLLGALQLYANNKFTGDVHVNAGRTQIEQPNSLGMSNSVYIYPGAQVNIHVNNTIGNRFFIAGTGTQAEPTLGALRLYNSTILTNTITLMSDAVISAANSGTFQTNQLSGKITGAGALSLLSVNSSTVVQLNNQANDWPGGLSIYANPNIAGKPIYVKLGTNDVIPDGLSAGNVTLASTKDAARLDLNGFNETINGLVSTVGYSTYNVVGNFAATPSTLTLGNNDASATFGGVLTDGGAPGTLSLVKIGNGTQTLSQPNTYTGTTTVNGGTLALAGAGTIDTSPTIAVNNATLDVSGLSGPFAYPNSIALTGGTLQLGANTAYSSSSTLNLTNSTLALKLNAAQTAIVTGTLSTGGATNLIQIASIPGQFYPVTYHLIQYTTAANLVDASNHLMNLGVSLPGGGNPVGYLTNDTVSNTIDLVLTSGPGPVVPITWNGNLNGNWDILGTTNWKTADGTSYYFQDTSDVTFDDTASGTTTVNLTTALAPASVMVNNTSKNYTWSGPGSLTGATALIKQGSGLLAIATSNTFSGRTTLNAGVLDVQASGALGSGSVSVADQSALQVDGPGLTLSNALTLTGAGISSSGVLRNLGNTNTLMGAISLFGDSRITSDAGLLRLSSPAALNGNNFQLSVAGAGNTWISSVISGIGGLVKDGAGTLTLSAANAFGSVPVTVNQGILQPAAANVFPSGSMLTINSGATLDVNAMNLGTTYTTVSGAGVGGAGAIVNNSTNQQIHALNKVQLNGDTTFGGVGRWDIRDSGAFPGALIIPGESATLTKTGPNQISLVNVGVTGNLTDVNVRQGMLSLESNTGLGNPAGTLTVFPGATLNLWSLAAPLDKSIVLQGDGLTDTLRGASGFNTITPTVGAVTLSSNCIFNVNGGLTINSGISGNGSLKLTGRGLVVLTGASTYTGDTVITNGTLALANSATLAGTKNIAVAGGATFDVSGLTSAFALGSSQSLSNCSSTAVLNGNLDASVGTLALNCGDSTPSFLITNGTLTLAPTMRFVINNTGAPLAAGTYKLIAAASAGNPGAVAGSLPAGPVAVNGGGLAPGGSAVLTNSNSELYLVVTLTTLPTPRVTGIRVNGTTLTLTATNGAASGTYVLLQSTNLALPSTNWSPVLTNTFDANGNLNLSTNLIDSSRPRMFYMLKQ